MKMEKDSCKAGIQKLNAQNKHWNYNYHNGCRKAGVQTALRKKLQWETSCVCT